MVKSGTFLSKALSGAVASVFMASGLLAPIAMPQTASAAEKRHETHFNVKFGAVSVGKMVFGVSMKGNDYTFTGNGKTKGLAEWFSPGNAVIKSEGAVEGQALKASSHYLSVTEDKKTAVLKMSFSGGTVQDVSMKPDKRKKRKNKKKYVVITPDDLKNVVDPASTMVIPVPLEKANDPNAVCNRTFRVYDGETRFDMKLTYKANKPIKTKGYDGNAYVCRFRYVPVAGHKHDEKNVERMAANNDMEIWLAPIDGGTKDQSIFTAIRISVPSWVGTFTAEPEYFGPAKS